MPRIRTTPALVALIALAATSASRATHAEDCLAGPNAQSPQGSHWFYRIDRATHRKCWYLGALHGQRAQHRRSAARADSMPAAPDDDDTAPAEKPAAGALPHPPAQAADRRQAGIVAAPPDPGFVSQPAEQPPRANVAPEAAAPAVRAATESPPPEQLAPRAVATTTERMRPAAPAKLPETAKPAPAVAIPAAPAEGHGALPAALFGIALLLAAAGTMLVRARTRIIRVGNTNAAPASGSRRARRSLSDILAQAERGEPDRADAAARFFDRLRRASHENGAQEAADDESLFAPPRAANDMADIAAATLQPQIEELPPEPIAPAPDVEQTLRQLLAQWERRAA